ncbi:MAG TPA: hypothetical protein PLO33_11765 [Kouleothrix sp.]|uniref:hypothetical protein n=1 Tax=Kouleothrix sp. TaxID=2779161 RepID=UPI002C4A9FE0|nr:hypothetical protein [Kouleothrix sp.]
MPFTIERWRHELRNIIDDIARDPSDALARSGTPTLYPMLLGCTMLPIVAAYDEAPNGVMSALVSLAGGFGVNLIANLIQGKYMPTGTLLITTYEAQSLELGPAYEKIAYGLHVFELAETALLHYSQHTLCTQLRAELGRHWAAPLVALAAGDTPQRGSRNVL